MSEAIATIQLQQVDQLAAVPEDQLQWLIEHSELIQLKPGDPLFIPGQPSDYLYILLSGRIRIWLGAGNETRELARIEAGSITGNLPYSRVQSALANSAALVDSQVLRTHKDHFREMIRDHFELTRAFVHEMNNRIRNFTTLQQQNEKLVSLGKLSAGLAHELNNPASALVRTARALKSHLSYLPENFKKVMMIRMEEEEVDAVNEVMAQKMAAGMVGEMTLMERTDKEDDFRDWMEDNDLDDDDELIENLVEFGFTPEDLERIQEQTPDRNIQAVIKWVGDNLTTERMVEELEDASKRISELVGSIKSYTHMDQTQDRQLVDVHEGLKNTIVILKHKLKRNGIKLDKDIDLSIPRIPAYPGELNQIWTNLIDNALDAMDERGGTLTVRTGMDGPCVKVQIQDSGKGIPADVLPRIFDPFFTTKPMGKGTGLGLDVVQKLVLHHGADISVESEPGKTTFTLLFRVD
ncbi:MAG: ATP-binding protein [Bacteroidota bacterium]